MRIWKAEALTNLGNVCRELGEFHESQIMLDEALKIKEEFYDSQHPEVAKILSELGNTYGHQGDLVRGKLFLERALKIREISYRTQHPEIAKNLNDLGGIYNELGQHERAKQLVEKALSIQNECGTEVETSKTLNNLGKIYHQTGDLVKAKESLEAALKIQMKYYDRENTMVARTLFYLAQVDFDLKDLNSACSLMEKSYRIFLDSYGSSHYITVRASTLLDQYVKSTNF